MSTDPSFGTEAAPANDNLIAGHAPVRGVNVTILSGQTIARGAVLGQITASGKWILSLSAAVDGSQTPKAIAAAAIDASAADKVGGIYIAGDFNERELILGTAHTLTTVRNAFRGTPIFILPTIAE